MTRGARLGEFAFLLRGWQEEGDQAEAPRPGGSAPVWRFSLEDPHSGERLGFSSLERLVTALNGRVAAGQEPIAGDEQGTAGRVEYEAGRRRLGRPGEEEDD